jgi:hypothetical protein
MPWGIYINFQRCFSVTKNRNSYGGKQRQLLLGGQVQAVIENIRLLSANPNGPAAKLIAYYQANINRMDYKRYSQPGCGLIGSGAIESARRTVIQKSMKQSGQRRTMNGARHMLNLIMVKKNHQWDKIMAITKANFSATA